MLMNLNPLGWGGCLGLFLDNGLQGLRGLSNQLLVGGADFWHGGSLDPWKGRGLSCWGLCKGVEAARPKGTGGRASAPWLLGVRLRAVLLDQPLDWDFTGKAEIRVRPEM